MKSLIMILFSYSLYAANLDDCRVAYSRLGDGSGLDKISDGCKDLVEANSVNIGDEYKEDDVDLVFAGLGNALIYIDKVKGTRYMTSGSSTMLEDVSSIKYDHSHKEVYVLDAKTNQVMVYPSQIPGNIAPIRLVKKDEIIGASDIAVFADSLYILNSVTNKVIVMNRLASVKARKTLQYLNIIQEVPVSNNADRIEIENGNLILYAGDDKVMTLTLSE